MHALAFVFEVFGVLGAVGVVAVLTRALGHIRRDLRLIAGAVIAAIVFAFACANLADAISALNQARRDGVGTRAGLERCFVEDHFGAWLPFINWVKARLPAHAVYALGPYSGRPDGWCISLVLLPALQEGPGGQPGWVITLGTVPPDLEARIARHDPSVRVFAPGFALAKEGQG